MYKTESMAKLATAGEEYLLAETMLKIFDFIRFEKVK
jgi:hypothetical protein